jgi:hypothetical protein
MALGPGAHGTANSSVRPRGSARRRTRSNQFHCSSARWPTTLILHVYHSTGSFPADCPRAGEDLEIYPAYYGPRRQTGGDK